MTVAQLVALSGEAREYVLQGLMWEGYYMKVGYVGTIKQLMGGHIYNNMVQDVLSKHFDVQTVNIKYTRRLFFPYALYRLCKINGEKDLWVRDFNATITMPYDKTIGKNIAIIHHIDSSGYAKHIQIILALLEKVFYRNLERVNAIVTVSKYWQEYFLRKGYSNTYVIYNAFNVTRFNFSQKEISGFVDRFDLKGKPIIYIGNCQKAKGVVEAYEALKGLDAYIVTSGPEEVKIPAINLNLGYRDYLRLLKASSVVVTMSTFKEGWCRTAHEAMLCKTPVVGSGLGGMKELLEDGKQAVCSDFDELRQRVEYLMEHPEIGERGYEFAAKFTVKRFEREWIALANKVAQQVKRQASYKS